MPDRLKNSKEPRARDAARSQASILQAARDEFAEHGLGGARVDRIAGRAGLNKRLIYYYFEEKEKLFQAVLEQAYLHIREAEHKLSLLAQKPADATRSLVEFTWNYYLAHPEFLTLLNSANLHRARRLETSKSVREMNSPLIATLGEILERSRRDGSFRGGITRYFAGLRQSRHSRGLAMARPACVWQIEEHLLARL